jgi:hypothetical protein
VCKVGEVRRRTVFLTSEQAGEASTSPARSLR